MNGENSLNKQDHKKAFLKLFIQKIKTLNTIILKITKKIVNKLAKITNLSRKEVSVIIVATTISLIVLCIYFPKSKEVSTAANIKKTTSKAGTLTKGTPSYKTLLPAGKTIRDLGGWTRVSPSNVDPVYAFIDKIGTIPINISQQPLPKEFKDDTDTQVASLATDFKATEKITIGGTNVYIGTSAKGPQSVIFTKSGLLILIKSSVQISNDKWGSYVNSLQ